jgi:hypothetical protein
MPCAIGWAGIANNDQFRMNKLSEDMPLSSHLVQMRIVAAALAFALFLNSGVLGKCMAADKPPFEPGERLKYELSWEFLPAGEAILEVLPSKTVGSVPAYHFGLSVMSYAYIDPFYKVRDQIDAYAARDMTRSILYQKDQLEGKTRRRVRVHFDWNNRQARYTNFDRAKGPIAILPGTFDPLAVLYYARLLDLEEGGVIERPVTDGKKCVTAKAKILRREKITVAAGTYDTFLLEPEFDEVGGVFEKSKDATIQIWISADAYRIPVKVQSKVVVGSFVGELVSVDRGPENQKNP